jgi:hypothetical protein
VLRQVHDVAFALVSRRPPCTVYPSASQEAGVDVACVVLSVARGSLSDGALDGRYTHECGAESYQSTLSQAHSRDASTRLRLFSICRRSTRIHSVRLVEATHDSWPAPTCIDVQHVGML